MKKSICAAVAFMGLSTSLAQALPALTPEQVLLTRAVSLAGEASGGYATYDAKQGIEFKYGKAAYITKPGGRICYVEPSKDPLNIFNWISPPPVNTAEALFSVYCDSGVSDHFMVSVPLK